MTRYFKVKHKAGAFIDGVYYPPESDSVDVMESVVPIEFEDDARLPLWGVEVNENGEEIGQAPVSAREKLGDALGNKLAGKEPVQAPVIAKDKDAEARAETIRETLELLDSKNDNQWTGDDKPKVDVVADASGLNSLSRAEIEAAAPGFTRTAE